MNVCPECGEQFPGEAILVRHREFEHPEEYAAALEAAAEARALHEATAEEEGSYTDDGFLKRVGVQGQARPDYLGSLFPKPEQPTPPWERERLERGSEK